MRNYVIKIGFSTDNAMLAANLHSEIFDAITFDVETKDVNHNGFVIVPDEIITESDIAADKAFDDEAGLSFELERMIDNGNDAP